MCGGVHVCLEGVCGSEVMVVVGGIRMRKCGMGDGGGRARWWRGVGRDVDEAVKKCVFCERDTRHISHAERHTSNMSHVTHAHSLDHFTL